MVTLNLVKSCSFGTKTSEFSVWHKSKWCYQGEFSCKCRFLINKLCTNTCECVCLCCRTVLRDDDITAGRWGNVWFICCSKYDLLTPVVWNRKYWCQLFLIRAEMTSRTDHRWWHHSWCLWSSGSDREYNHVSQTHGCLTAGICCMSAGTFWVVVDLCTFVELISPGKPTPAIEKKDVFSKVLGSKRP